MKFRCGAFDANGQAVSRVVDASSAADAAEALRRDGLFVGELAPISGGAAAGPAAGAKKRGRAPMGRLKTLATFSRQLSVLVSTGTPLVDALGALERQARDARFAAIVRTVRQKVEEGVPLSEAMSQHPQYFDAVCRSLVAAGESGGKLDSMLQRLAELSRAQHKIASALIGAMIYPCLLMVVAVGVLCVMLLFVLPRFTGLFGTLGVPLPVTTRALLVTSEALSGYWWAALIGLAGLVAGAVFGLRSDAGRRAVQTAMVRAPQVGRTFRAFATARLARLLGVLLESKVPMLEALELTRQTCTNMHYAALLTRAQEALTRGDSLSAVFAATPLIDASLCEAVRNGERSGRIGTVLLNMADFLDDENEVIVKSLTSIVEPIILIGLGLVVGVVALSMFLPLFDLTAMAGGAPGTPGGAP